MTSNPYPKLKVIFLGCSKDPIEILYSSHKIRNTRENIQKIWQRIQAKSISRKEMANSLPNLRTNTLPTDLKQARFVFMVDNISWLNAISLIRQNIDPDRLNPSGASPRIQKKEQLAVTPPSFRTNTGLMKRWIDLQSEVVSFYQECLESGIDPDEAGMALPVGLLCREQISMTFQAMQQFLDIKMCEQNPLEIKEMSWQIYRLMQAEFPALAKRLGIKCWENRNLFCNEPVSQYKTCRWSQSRPHRKYLGGIWNQHSQPVSEESHA